MKKTAFAAFAALALSAGSCGESVSPAGSANGAANGKTGLGFAELCRQHLNAHINCLENLKPAVNDHAETQRDLAIIARKIKSCGKHADNAVELARNASKLLSNERYNQIKENSGHKEAVEVLGALRSCGPDFSSSGSGVFGSNRQITIHALYNCLIPNSKKFQRLACAIFD